MIVAEGKEKAFSMNVDLGGNTLTNGYFLGIATGSETTIRVVVADDAARYALTDAVVKNGSIVYVVDGGMYYMVSDQSQLSTGNGYLGPFFSNGTAPGQYAVNLGGAVAFGGESRALGAVSYAVGSRGVTLGYASIAAAPDALAAGPHSTAGGDYSLSLGSQSTAGGLSAVSAGFASVANGRDSFALGPNALTGAPIFRVDSFGIGTTVTITGVLPGALLLADVRKYFRVGDTVRIFNGSYDGDSYATEGNPPQALQVKTISAISFNGTNTILTVNSPLLAMEGIILLANISYGLNQFAQGGAIFFNASSQALPGSAQRNEWILSRTTSNATAAELTLDGITPSASNRIRIIEGRASLLSIKIIGLKDDGTANTYERRATIKNVAGTTSIAGVQTIGTDTEGAPAWDIAVQADDINDSLQIMVTGAASTNIHWLASVEALETAW